MKFILIFVSLVSAISVASTNVKKTNPPSKSHLSTNVDFEDQLVNGKYAYPDEATATVEDEKLLNDLLAVRKNFKDRLKQTSVRN